MLVPRVLTDDLVLEAMDDETRNRNAPPSEMVMRAQKHMQAMAAKPRTKVVRRVSGKPFSNYQKYQAKAQAVVGQSVHVTSVGPYISKLDQMALEEQDKKVSFAWLPCPCLLSPSRSLISPALHTFPRLFYRLLSPALSPCRVWQARSIHKDTFKPGGLWDKWEPPPGGWGFAAAGFMLPDDLPATAKRFGSFHNTHAHQFRYTRPKENLYM